jgi:2-polyprenyl-3-methyl-5-hydroxy-6-metoxy-1,4-benzoquinol methylase
MIKEAYETKPTGYFENSRPEMLALLPQGSRKVLDMGCGSGILGRELIAKGIEVWGIEYDCDSAAAARKNIDRVLCGDAVEQLQNVPEKYFDCIYFNDILEHLTFPEEALKAAVSKLTPGGRIICSIPNVRHMTNLINLVIHKDWEYTSHGILDNTHFRFFTRKSLIRFFEKHGLGLESIIGINPLKSWKFDLVNLLTLGHFSDSRYLQFACILKNK